VSDNKNDGFEPTIVGYLCNWCTYAAADVAGSSRLQYPHNIRAIRVMCSGSVDPLYILRALFSGADAVLVSGCRPGDCHYVSGNYKERRRMVVLKTILDTLGLESDRVWLRWVAASEVPKFAATMNEVSAEVKKLGPNPIGSAWSV
jgi:F420-non-reducing hydrogenase iron-sulfur subunit